MNIRKKVNSKTDSEQSQFEKSPIEAGTNSNNKKTFKSKKIFTLILLVVVVGALGASAYTYGLYQRSQEQIKGLKANPEDIVKAETKRVTEEVSKLISLPENETPTVATVTDPKKLKNQPFFAQAESGDKVLIYTQTKKAILYRPDIKKIIEVAPINLGDESPALDANKESSITPSEIAGPEESDNNGDAEATP